jgi:arylsulfatase A-like enzyme
MQMKKITLFPLMLHAGILRCTVLCLLAVAASYAQAADKPNIVYVLADDLGWRDVGFHGGEAHTPNLDRLAAGGAVLNAFYVQPYSSQSRAALLTGRYPMRYGLQTMSITNTSRYGLPLEERTLAQRLKAMGYRTAFVGDWMLGHSKREFWPTQRGFDSFYGSLAGTTESLLRKDSKTDWHRGERAVNDAGYVTELLTREAVSLIQRNDFSSPLFLVIAFNAPARYAAVPQSLADSYRSIGDDSRRNYLAAVSGVDLAMGQVVAALESRNLLSNTVIVFHSDNGGAVPMRFATGDGDVRNAAADNGAFREGQGSLYEGGVRVAALMYWQQHIKPKTVVTEALHVTDISVTLRNLAGAPADPDQRVDGLDAWPAIASAQLTPHKELLINVDDFHGAIRVGEWKLIVHAALPAKIELFDLSNDPQEAENKAATYPDRANDLLGRLSTYAYEMAPSLYLDALGSAASPALWRANTPKRY